MAIEGWGVDGQGSHRGGAVEGQGGHRGLGCRWAGWQ